MNNRDIRELQQPLLCVDGRERLVRLRPGAVIEIRSLADQRGIVEIGCGGRALLAFHADLLERSEPVDTSPPAPDAQFSAFDRPDA